MAIFDELMEKKVRNQNIIKEEELAYFENRPSKITQDEYDEAIKNEAGQQINELYQKTIIPISNILGYLLYWVVTLITFPFTFYSNVVPAFVSYVAILFMVIILKMTEKRVQEGRLKHIKYIEKLEKFSTDTSVFMYLATSLGFMLTLFENEKWIFWVCYGAIAICSGCAFYHDVCKKKKD